MTPILSLVRHDFSEHLCSGTKLTYLTAGRASKRNVAINLIHEQDVPSKIEHEKLHFYIFEIFLKTTFKFFQDNIFIIEVTGKKNISWFVPCDPEVAVSGDRRNRAYVAGSDRSSRSAKIQKGNCKN